MQRGERLKMKKKSISLFLVLCMVLALFPFASFAEGGVSEKSDVKRVFDSAFYVEANPDAGLQCGVKVAYDDGGCIGKLYLPACADTEALFLCWDDEGLTVSRDGVVYESGTAPVAGGGEYYIYKVTRGAALAYVTVKTLKGSEGVASMFLSIDESLGTIAAMNGDTEHETECFGSLNFDGTDYAFISMKGRGNSTWGLDKKPYNITFYKTADYDRKLGVKLAGDTTAKKWSLLANHLDNSLLRNKVAMDLAQSLGIGLETRFVDLWMNGEYLGNYLMTPKNDYAAPDGGYVLENDNYLEPEEPQFMIPGMYEIGAKTDIEGYYNRITVKNIGDTAAEAGVDLGVIESYFTEAWNALTDYSSEDYQKYFDLDSWAKMFLMYEVTKTYDCFSGSLLMHRDGLTASDKLIAGPVWDYDNAFGRTLHKFIVGVTIPGQMSAEGWYNDSIGMSGVDRHMSLLQELGKHSSFMQRVSEIYNEYRSAFDGAVQNIGRQRDLLADSAAMNNDRWGTHHIGSYYVVLPTVIGTGAYAVSYQPTLTWDSYVSNMYAFTEKRVAWLTDHLCAEAPEGEISLALADGGGSVELTAELVSGQALSYQWQRSDDGVLWQNIDGETSQSLRLPAGETCSGVQYRCEVRSCGVEISTRHGGKLNAAAVGVIGPAELNVSVGTEVKETGLREGSLTMVMSGRRTGEFTFAPCGSGWSIMNAEGRYLAAEGDSLLYSDTPFAWSFDDGIFSAEVRVFRTKLGKLLGVSHSAEAYLTVSGGSLAVSLSQGAQASFLVTEKVVKIA